MFETELFDAKSDVELQYIAVKSTLGAVEKLRKYQDAPNVNYLDGITYSMTSGVIMIRRLTNKTIPGRVQRSDRPQDS